MQKTLPTLYILGGAARSGKTIIAQEFLEGTSTPYLSLDLLKMALVKGMPEVGVDPEDSSVKVAKQIWPVVRGLSTTILENDTKYLIEGDSILPSHTTELAKAFPGKVRACFVGFEKMKAADKLLLIRRYAGTDDWLRSIGDSQAHELVQEMIDFSKQIHAETKNFGIHYFESSADFRRFKEQVLLYLETG